MANIIKHVYRNIWSVHWTLQLHTYNDQCKTAITETHEVSTDHHGYIKCPVQHTV